MIIEIAVPAPGESITRVELARWLVEDGQIVDKDQELAEVESDKATLPLTAEKAGKIKFRVEAGTTVAVGAIVCTIDTDKYVTIPDQAKKPVRNSETKEGKNISADKNADSKTIQPPVVTETNQNGTDKPSIKVTPLAQKMMTVNALTVDDILKGIRKLTSHEVGLVLGKRDTNQARVLYADQLGREVRREPMSQLRKKLSQRLVAVKNETAMLTTFNEIDMSNLMSLRIKHQESFSQKYGVKLGIMSFFTKAAAVALEFLPGVNSMIEEENIIRPQFIDISIAVQTEKGLMVPVIRNVQSLTLADIEMQIAELAGKAKTFRLSISEMTGGTFSITNGGVFGSLLSTPILNPPQSAIMGMHAIIERPVAIQGKVEIRPMMNIALSYDHRIIDGRDSVGFLMKIKELIQSPEQLFGDIIKST
jgi:2-oxoglutarate dehydrogenase E2 component (dihydrolipoamide succinyltransferase)